MNAKQKLLLITFLLACLGFGYFGTQIVGATTTSTIGAGLIGTGVVMDSKSKHKRL